MRSEGDRLEAGRAGDDRHRPWRRARRRRSITSSRRGARYWNKIGPGDRHDRRRSGAKAYPHLGQYVRLYGGRDRARRSRCRPWVQDGGLEAWIARLKDPATRARVKAEMLTSRIRRRGRTFTPEPGPDGLLLLGVQEPQAQAAHRQDAGPSRARTGHQSLRTPRWIWWSRTARRVGVAYFLMDEANVRRAVKPARG